MKDLICLVWFEVLNSLTMNSSILRDAMPYSLSEIYLKDGDGRFLQNIPEFW